MITKKWNNADTKKLKWLYIDGGDKACIPMRRIAEELGRTEAACWSKLSRIFNTKKEKK